MKVTLIQSALVWGNVEENLKNFDAKLLERLDADIILLPEMFTSGCMMVKQDREKAMTEKITVAGYYEQVKEKMLNWAACQDALVIGSTVYQEGEKFYNRLLAAFPDGRCRYYDKRHCFRMGGEQEHFSAGIRHLVFDFRGMKIATFICYDLRFPVWSRNIQQYDLAVYIANWPHSRRDVWKTLLKARAIENQTFVAGLNCVGTDKNGLRYAGDSALIDARGQIIVEIAEFQERTMTGVCDIEELQRFRQKFAVLEDRDKFVIS